MIKKTGLLFFAAILGSNAGIAGSYLQTNFTKYYTISPRTAQDIARELNWRSPIHENGNTFHGHTDWNISWNYQVQQLPDGSCALTNIQTSIETKYTLPKLDERITNQDIISRFNRFDKALTKHEHNHGANGLKAVSEIDEALHTLTPQRNCRQLDQHANQIGHNIVRKYIAIDNEYDRSTQNGRTEGAYIQ